MNRERILENQRELLIKVFMLIPEKISCFVIAIDDSWIRTNLVTPRLVISITHDGSTESVTVRLKMGMSDLVLTAEVNPESLSEIAKKELEKWPRIRKRKRIKSE